MKKTTCPICNSKNNCQKSNDCWCMKLELSKETVTKINEKNIANMCICHRCLILLNK
ncbi:cysteine-rich CWC family protein [Pseudogracilibacillus auburnensis]|uniref:cysteine-rich CWC family protein n=1 Tax=Pseudogracilibacillus auburnensis TaxID=1494959 RepID=UPI0011B4AFB2|nr:cysteine-rich CWC family protein [Pseudogracilibacillus auburnensis]